MEDNILKYVECLINVQICGNVVSLLTGDRLYSQWHELKTCDEDYMNKVFEAISKSTRLEFIHIINRKLTNINLQSYGELRLSECDISDLVVNAPNLATLFITPCTGIIKDLYTPNLVYLDLNGDVGDMNYLNGALQLQQLHIIDRNIAKLPKNISKLQNLKKLTVWGGKITKIPKWCANFPMAKRISFPCNKIHILPKNVEQIKFRSLLEFLKDNPIYDKSETKDMNSFIEYSNKFRLLKFLVKYFAVVYNMPDNVITTFSVLSGCTPMQ